MTVLPYYHFIPIESFIVTEQINKCIQEVSQTSVIQFLQSIIVYVNPNKEILLFYLLNIPLKEMLICLKDAKIPIDSARNPVS